MSDKTCKDCGHSVDFHAADGCFWRPNINLPGCNCHKTGTHFRLDDALVNNAAMREAIDKYNSSYEAQAAEIEKLRKDNAALKNDCQIMKAALLSVSRKGGRRTPVMQWAQNTCLSALSQVRHD